MNRKQMKNRNLLDSFNNAINGIIHTLIHERNMKIHIGAALAVLAASLLLRLTKIEFLIVSMAVALVIICELFNTAVELVVDIKAEEYHPLAKLAKDVAAGAVMVSAVLSMIVGYFIFFEKLVPFFEYGILTVKQAPMNIAVTALIITMILTIVIKAFYKRGTPLKGGMPSGHAAAAFSITTAVMLWSGDAKITVLVLIVALMTVQTRHEAGIHSAWELAVGAMLGTFATLALFQIFFSF